MVKLSELYEKYTSLVQENQEHITSNVSDDDQLQIYSFYKQSEEGDCNIEEPAFYEFRKKSKYNAWKALEGITRNDAKKLYIKKVKEILEEEK
jgi:diazepam-binding inhibitor (GABA receptor modulator, acyl-CoA-binding protein)